MKIFLKPNIPFEIRCWNEENHIIRKYIPYGNICKEKCTDWEFSITGNLTDNLINLILSTPKPNETEQITDIFTINIGENISSSHYGKEIFLNNLADIELQRINEIILPIKDFFSYMVENI